MTELPEDPFPENSDPSRVATAIIDHIIAAAPQIAADYLNGPDGIARQYRNHRRSFPESVFELTEGIIVDRVVAALCDGEPSGPLAWSPDRGWMHKENGEFVSLGRAGTVMVREEVRQVLCWMQYEMAASGANGKLMDAMGRLMSSARINAIVAMMRGHNLIRLQE